MACLTSVYLDWRVFKDERTALVRVASKANGILSGRTAYLLWTHGSMYVVAVAALDQTFVHTMMKGHRKLCFLVEMARVAERGLRLDEKEFLRFRMVRGMARRAAYVVFRMFRIDGVHVLRATGMAGEALGVDFLRGVFAEDENLRFVTAASNVRGTGSVATLASLMRRAALCIKSGFPVRTLLPVVVNIFVTRLAHLRADEFGGTRCRGRSNGFVLSGRSGRVCAGRLLLGLRPRERRNENTCNQQSQRSRNADERHHRPPEAVN